jgi:hypothetical protein
MMTHDEGGPQEHRHEHDHRPSVANLLTGFERRDVVAELRDKTAYPWLHSLANLLGMAAIVWFVANVLATLPLMFHRFEAFLMGIAAIAEAGVRTVLLCLAAWLAHWIADLADMRIEKLIDHLQKRSKP